jgi:hypothetical protein
MSVLRRMRPLLMRTNPHAHTSAYVSGCYASAARAILKEL